MLYLFHWTIVSGEEKEAVEDGEEVVGTRERDFNNLLPRNNTNNNLNSTASNIKDTNTTLEGQPCFVCSFRWVLNGGPRPAGAKNFSDGNNASPGSGKDGNEEQEASVRSPTTESEVVNKGPLIDFRQQWLKCKNDILIFEKQENCDKVFLCSQKTRR